MVCQWAPRPEPQVVLLDGRAGERRQQRHNGSVTQGEVFSILITTKHSIWRFDPRRDQLAPAPKVLDCVFHGNHVAGVGLYAQTPTTLIAQRLEFYDFTDEGIRASDNAEGRLCGSTPIAKYHPAISTLMAFTTILLTDSNGTAEASVWVGIGNWR